MEFVSVFLRMVFIIYIPYKENICAECKPVFRINHTLKIVRTLGEGWLEEKSTAGITGTRNEETVSYHLRQLPAKKENDFCVCSTGTKHGPVKSWRSRTVCISSVRRVFTDGASPKDVCFA